MKLPKYIYSVVDSSEKRFEMAVGDVMARIELKSLVRITFFVDSHNNREYAEKLQILRDSTSQIFGDTMPAWSLVAQTTLGDMRFAAEVCSLSDDNEGFELDYQPFGVVVRGEGYEEIVAGGIDGDCVNQTLAEQCKSIFEQMEAILAKYNCGVERIVRQWNYIEHITRMEDGEQNYQVLNDARSEFYAKGDWSKAGYPAATGIGSTAGGVVVDFNALVRCDGAQYVALDNPLQIAAHVYSDCLLLGEAEVKTTPKFERAKGVAAEGVRPMIYVSGTAAIRGEESLEISAAEQTVITMENIAYLLSKENQERYGVVGELEDMECGNLRVYIKYATDFKQVKAEVERMAPGVPSIYLFGDVCRDELLVEIEGVAL